MNERHKSHKRLGINNNSIPQSLLKNLDATSKISLKVDDASKSNKMTLGIMSNQWKKIGQFEIVGQRKNKKGNLTMAMDHYFNMKSMFRRINEARGKSKPLNKKISNDKCKTEVYNKNEVKIKQMEKIEILNNTERKSSSKSFLKKKIKPNKNTVDNNDEVVNISESIKKDKSLRLESYDKVLNDYQPNLNKEMTQLVDNLEIINIDNNVSKTDFKNLKAKNTKEYPVLEDYSNTKINEFLEEVLKIVIEQQLFTEQSFAELFNNVCMANKNISPSALEELFDQVRGVLHEQLEELED